MILMVNRGCPAPTRKIVKSDDEWQSLLTPEQFRITRKKGTEPAGSGEFCHAHESGIYHCVCCDNPLFKSDIKFDSKSGWPSFTEPLADNAVKYNKDDSYGMVRVEVVCNSCDAHLGHVFPDWPPPTGLRYCINSESMKISKLE